MAASTDWKEEIAADEPERFERHAALLTGMQRKRAGATVHRALHAKANLGLEAQFEVLPGLPDEARVGMFATPKTYPAVVRYSNGAGRHQADAKPDVRGIAVKLIGVDGKKVIPGLEDATTQDFLAIRTPSVPMRNADEFIALVRAADSPALLPLRLMGALGIKRGFQMLRALLASLGAPMTTLASTGYFSALPIQYGPYAVHYALRPHDSLTPAQGRDPMHLGQELAKRVVERPVIYDFQVQFFQDAARTPIEDASVEWKTTDAPFVTVARLTIPVQDPNSARGQKLSEYVEKLSFDPWHARHDLRPLGNMMRARNHAYRHSTQTRGAAPEPTELPSFD